MVKEEGQVRGERLPLRLLETAGRSAFDLSKLCACSVAHLAVTPGLFVGHLARVLVWPD